MRTPQDTATAAGLNRALLARQGLLDRHTGPGGAKHSGKALVSAIEQIGALQAQQWSSPPVGLWSRLANFASDDLWAVLDKGDVVTGILMRRTLHPQGPGAKRTPSRQRWPVCLRCTGEGE